MLFKISFLHLFLFYCSSISNFRPRASLELDKAFAKYIFKILLFYLRYLACEDIAPGYNIQQPLVQMASKTLVTSAKMSSTERSAGICKEKHRKLLSYSTSRSTARIPNQPFFVINISPNNTVVRRNYDPLEGGLLINSCILHYIVQAMRIYAF